MTTVMMTGSTGFIGRYLTDQLLEAGYDLRLLVRSPSKAREFERRGAELIEGNLTDPESVRRSMQGVDGVIHLAAIYRLGGDLERMRSVNVEGTRVVLDEARRQDVSRILYCGSDTSLGNTDGSVRDEGANHDGTFRSNYARTKREAHQLVNERIEDGQPIVHAIVSSVYGPGDDSPIADLIRNHLAGHAVALLDEESGYTFTYVEDVASGLRKVYESGEIGEEYLISGEPATFKEFFSSLSDQTGVSSPRYELSDWILKPLQTLISTGSSFFGQDPSVIDEMIAMGNNVTRFFSSDKTREELDWEPRPLAEGLRETIPWFGRKEYEESRRLLSDLKTPLGGLALFDIALGLTTTAFPDLYDKLLHNGPSEEGSTDRKLLSRTGTLWLVFAAVQGVAYLEPENRPEWVMAAGVLRLMDVPADPVYYERSRNLTGIGRLGLLSAPIFNLASGGLFLYAGYRGLRARKWETIDTEELPFSTDNS